MMAHLWAAFWGGWVKAYTGQAKNAMGEFSSARAIAFEIIWREHAPEFTSETTPGLKASLPNTTVVLE
jgi:hypothetical protein